MDRSRRRFLGSVGVTAGAGLAGCLSRVRSIGDPGEVDTGGDPPATEADAQFRGGLRRHGVYPDRTVPESVEVDWRIEAVNTGDHTAAKASPVLAPDGDVIVPGDTGELRRVTPDGEVVWTTDATDATRGFHGTPVIANGAIYVGGYDGVLYALDLDSGDVYWRESLADAIGSSPAYHDGTVYVAVEYADPSGAMYAVDAITGEVEWDDQRPTDHPHSTCAIDREAGRLVVGANDGVLYAWSFPDLEFEWEFETGDAIKGPVATHDGRAFFGSWDHHVYAVSLDEGAEEWRFETANLVMSGPSIEPATDTLYVGSHDHDLYALELATGEYRWSSDTDARIVGCPTVTAEHVLAGSVDNRLYAFEAGSGDRVWTVEGNGFVTSTPLVADDGIYVADRASESYLESGEGPTGALYRLTAAD